MARKHQMISGDSHLDIVPERWAPHVPVQWRDRAPRRVTLPNGNDGLIIENRPPHTPSFQLTGKSYDLHDVDPVRYATGPGTGTPEQRLREQDQDGVDAEVMYTHPSYPSFWRGIKDDEVYVAMIHAFNEWLAEEYCAYAPERLLAMAVIPDTGIDDAVKELEYCARAGLKGVCLYRFPNGKGYPMPEDDRFWATAIDLNMPVTSHTAGGTTRFVRDGAVFPYAHAPKDIPPSRDPISVIIRFAGDTAFAPMQMAFAGVFDRFPTLRVYWAETQVGWLPYTLSQIDDNYERNRYWGQRLYGLEPLKRLPHEYLQECNLWGFMKDPFGVALRDHVGVKALLWGSDFAHAQGDWPHSRRVVDEIMAGVPESERYLMLAGNAVEFFHLKAEFEEPAGRQAAATVAS